MKTYSQEQLKEMAVEHFQRLGVNKLFATSDGQFFLLENRANLHAAGRNVYPILNEETKSSRHLKGLPIDQLTKKVGKTTDVDALRQMMLVEVVGENRAEAIEIIDLRIRELINDPKDVAFRGDSYAAKIDAYTSEKRNDINNEIAIDNMPKPEETQQIPAKKTPAKKTAKKATAKK